MTARSRATVRTACTVFMLGGRIWVRNPCRPLSAAGKGKGCADTRFVSPRAPDCPQYMFRDWARYHATRTSGRRCAHHLLAITSLPARKGVEISGGSAPDNDAAPSVAPLYHSLKLCPVASLEECSRTDLSTDRVTSRPSLGRAFVARRRRLYNPGGC